MEYTAVIRTLGKAGEKYQTLLDSLNKQTVPPVQILVYIAEGYAIPKETIGKERYIYVKKGMVAQRALRYDEVDTEYILFLDDDVYLPKNAVELLYYYLMENQANVISPDVFLNAERSLIGKLMMAISGRMWPHRDDGKWGYKVMRNSGYSYNINPQPGIYSSQTNAGPCFFCRKMDFLKIHFEEELWMDQQRYALGDDQVMFYKMYLMGLKQLTWFYSGIRHLDAGTAMIDDESVQRMITADFRFKIIFWHRFIYQPDNSFLSKVWSCICVGYTFGFALLISVLKGNWNILHLKYKAIKDAIQFIESDKYQRLPQIQKYIK